MSEHEVGRGTPTGGDEEARATVAEAEPIEEARRRLLELGVYAAPAVIGSLLISRVAAAQGSCGPTTCGPTCHPQGGPCQPDNCKPRNP